MKNPTLLLTAVVAATSGAFANPERESARIAGGLRSFSDQDWTAISGERRSEKYEIARGDNLWNISARLFGDAKVWPKVWEINNTTILNPHMIEPRTALTFNAGSGLSLPSLVIGGSLNNAGTSTVKNHYVVAPGDRAGGVWDEKTPFPSSEWQRLPRQSWENVAINLPGNIDKDGFDTRNRIYLRKPATGLELPHFVACAPVTPLGKIEGTRSVSTYVYRGSEVTITATGTPLEINRVYTLMDPQPSELQMKTRKALSYDILGKVKILGLQNGTYVGEILAARETVMRGAILVPEIKRIDKQAPVAGASKVKGTILADRRTGAFMSGQHKWIYIDRGTRDGVERGMIFRIFQNSDPKTNRPLTRGDVFVQGDAQVVQGCEDFSIGTFIWSRGEVPEQYEGELLTDLADEKIRFYFNGEASDLPISDAPLNTAPSEIIDAPKPEPKTAIIGPGPTEHPETLAPVITDEKKPGSDEDWLDKLDTHQELQSDEEHELKELEKYRESKAAEAPTATPDADPASMPPPPEAGVSAMPAAPTADALPPAPDSEFPSSEPVVEVPTTVLNSAPTQSAQAPKGKPSPSPSGAIDENSVEGLTPL